MKFSLPSIEKKQKLWGSKHAALHMTRDTYVCSVRANLFLSKLLEATEAEFSTADGSELTGSADRPAKMCALVSSSALAVNFFDAWRSAESLWPVLAKSLGFTSAIQAMRFEYKPERYPVGPRTPNIDLLLTLRDGRRVGVESKFAEPYRSASGKVDLSKKYFPDTVGLWAQRGMPGAQRVAEDAATDWSHLDVAQLLKHMLGLASESQMPATLLYLWYDSGFKEGETQRAEVARFAGLVSGDRVDFSSITYQELFAALSEASEPVANWRSYMASRYFA